MDNISKTYSEEIDTGMSANDGVLSHRPSHNKDFCLVAEELDLLSVKVDGCKKCELHNFRQNAVFGEGNVQSKIFLVGEAPGYNEDIQKRPFVGRSGKLLDQLIEEALGSTRASLYIANVVKCRPPDNRTPQKLEINSCLGYLNKQIELVSPKVIIALGNTAFKALVDATEGVTQARLNLYSYRDIDVVPTFHPSAALRNGKRVVDMMREDLVKAGRLACL